MCLSNGHVCRESSSDPFKDRFKVVVKSTRLGRPRSGRPIQYLTYTEMRLQSLWFSISMLIRYYLKPPPVLEITFFVDYISFFKKKAILAISVALSGIHYMKY